MSYSCGGSSPSKHSVKYHIILNIPYFSDQADRRSVAVFALLLIRVEVGVNSANKSYVTRGSDQNAYACFT